MTTPTLTAYQLMTTTTDCEDAIRAAYAAAYDAASTDGYGVGADDCDEVRGHDDEIGMPLYRVLPGDLAVYWTEGSTHAVLVGDANGAWAVDVEVDTQDEDEDEPATLPADFAVTGADRYEDDANTSGWAVTVAVQTTHGEVLVEAGVEPHRRGTAEAMGHARGLESVWVVGDIDGWCPAALRDVDADDIIEAVRKHALRVWRQS